MVSELRKILLMLVCVASLLAATFGVQLSAEEGSESLTESRMSWIQVDQPVVGLVVDSGRLQLIGVSLEASLGLDMDEEIIQADPSTRKTIRRYFQVTQDGRRRLSRVVEEEVRTLPDGGITGQKTESVADLNGRVRVINRQVQNTVATGSSTWKTSATYLTPDSRGDLRAVQRVEQLETRGPSQIDSIERSLEVPDANGRWRTLERRVGQVQQSDQGLEIQESVYVSGERGKLILKNQVSTLEWEDGEGTHRAVDTYRTDRGGGVELIERLTFSEKLENNGDSEVVQVLETRATRSGRMAVAERMTQSTRTIVSGSRSTALTVERLNSNGKVASRESHWFLITEESTPGGAKASVVRSQ